MVGRATTLAALVLTACSAGPTTLLLTLDGPAALTSLDVTVTLDGGGSTSQHIAISDGSTKLHGTLLVVLPDRAVGVSIDVVGHGAGADLTAHTTATASPHHQVDASIVLGAPSDADLGPSDLARPIDAAASDLSNQDLGVAAPVPRLISSSYFTDWNSATYSFPSGMSRTHFIVDTTGVVDGDLLIFIANIDNGSNTVWPNPIAPGFNQLAQVFFGSDGQTYVVAWKWASGEPATYSGNYGSGGGSGSMVIDLIAVSGANRTTPINAFLTSNGNSGAMPAVATSAGVTTTAAHCLILYAAGADWLGTPGSNTFTAPAGYTELAHLGDHGNDAWDWSSEGVAFTTQAAAGPTGSLSGTLSGTLTGIPWSAVLAIAP